MEPSNKYLSFGRGNLEQIEIEHHAMLMVMKCAVRGSERSEYNIYLQYHTCLFIKRGIVCFTCYHWGLTAAESRWCMSQYVDWRGFNIAHQYENQFLAEIALGSTSSSKKVTNLRVINPAQDAQGLLRETEFRNAIIFHSTSQGPRSLH